jgi:hypothetical protein
MPERFAPYRAHARRHPAEVTADRLLRHYEEYYEMMSGSERDELSHIRFVLQEIADGNRERINRHD